MDLSIKNINNVNKTKGKRSVSRVSKKTSLHCIYHHHPGQKYLSGIMQVVPVQKVLPIANTIEPKM